MSFKPLPRKDFEKKIKKVGWKLVKGSIDWKLYDEKDCFFCTIKCISSGSCGKWLRDETKVLSDF